MPSPFPGMNPYLEQSAVWQDFHDTFIPAIRESLSPQLSPHFVVKIEESLLIHEPSAAERIRGGRADVALTSLLAKVTQESPAMETSTAQATLDAPRQLTVSTDFDIAKHLFLEIYDRQLREVVTVIELLSPSNKNPGGDREQYLHKRRGILRSYVHFVEIDLLRGGPRMPVEEAAEGDYGVLVSKYEDRPKVGFWPISLRDRLPRIPIPLRDPIPVAWLDLQAIVHTVYDRAYYKDYIYNGQPEPPLTDADRVWAEEILKSASK